MKKVDSLGIYCSKLANINLNGSVIYLGEKLASKTLCENGDLTGTRQKRREHFVGHCESGQKTRVLAVKIYELPQICVHGERQGSQSTVGDGYTCTKYNLNDIRFVFKLVITLQIYHSFRQYGNLEILQLPCLLGKDKRDSMLPSLLFGNQSFLSLRLMAAQNSQAIHLDI